MMEVSPRRYLESQHGLRRSFLEVRRLRATTIGKMLCMVRSIAVGADHPSTKRTFNSGVDA